MGYLDFDGMYFFIFFRNNPKQFENCWFRISQKNSRLYLRIENSLNKEKNQCLYRFLELYRCKDSVSKSSEKLTQVRLRQNCLFCKGDHTVLNQVCSDRKNGIEHQDKSVFTVSFDFWIFSVYDAKSPEQLLWPILLFSCKIFFWEVEETNQPDCYGKNVRQLT